MIDKRQEVSLIQNYLETKYQVLDPRGKNVPFDLYIDDTNLLFNDWLKKEKIKTWALLTAYNPMSRKYPDKWNKMKLKSLKSQLEKSGYRILPSVGTGPADEWKEPGFFIANIRLDDLIALGHTYNQKAAVHGTQRSAPKLLILI